MQSKPRQQFPVFERSKLLAEEDPCLGCEVQPPQTGGQLLQGPFEVFIEPCLSFVAAYGLRWQPDALWTGDGDLQ